MPAQKQRPGIRCGACGKPTVTAYRDAFRKEGRKGERFYKRIRVAGLCVVCGVQTKVEPAPGPYSYEP